MQRFACLALGLALLLVSTRPWPSPSHLPMILGEHRSWQEQPASRPRRQAINHSDTGLAPDFTWEYPCP